MYRRAHAEQGAIGSQGFVERPALRVVPRDGVVVGMRRQHRGVDVVELAVAGAADELQGGLDRTSACLCGDVSIAAEDWCGHGRLAAQLLAYEAGAAVRQLQYVYTLVGGVDVDVCW